MTKQVGDRLTVDGETVSMPSYFPLPEGVESISSMSAGYVSGFSACWRGYVATWKIEDDKLFLTQIDGLRGQRPSRQLTSPGPVLASWFNGSFRVPRGARIIDRRSKYQDVFEQEELIDVANGLVVERRMIDNRGAEQS